MSFMEAPYLWIILWTFRGYTSLLDSISVSHFYLSVSHYNCSVDVLL